jgi:hypothetical protein
MYRGRHLAFLSGPRQLSVITGYPYGVVPLRPVSVAISALFLRVEASSSCPDVSGRVSSVKRRVFGNVFATLSRSKSTNMQVLFPPVRNPSKLFIRF